MKPALLKALLKRVPLITRVYILSLLSLSPTGGKQDVRTELLVNIFRSFINQGGSQIGKVQYLSSKPYAPLSRTWVAEVKIPKPEDDVLAKLLQVVNSLKDEDMTYDIPELKDVEGEWVGYRANVDPKAPLPDVSEAEKYKLMMKEVKEDVTVLYLHGGAY